MRVARVLTFVGAAIAVGGSAQSGCGGDDAAVPIDASTDVPVDNYRPPLDTGPEVAPPDTGVDTGCPIDGSPGTIFPDASPDDAGASPVDCVVCMRANCASDVKICDEDCDCMAQTMAFLQCLQKQGETIGDCVAKTQGNTNAFTLATCVGNSCANECAPPAPEGGADAGDASGDAAVDAPLDAPSDASDSGGG